MSIPGTPESSPLDIADHVNRNWEACDQDALISLLTPCFHPSSGDSDPVNDADGAFHVAHQQQYPWLAYSPSARGAYCRFCSLGFAVGWQGHRLPWHAQLVGTPLDAAKKSTAYYANHEKTTYHNHARAQAEQFWVTVSPLPLMISVPAAEPKNWKAAEREYKRLTGQGGVGGEGPLSAEDERPVRQTVRGIYCDQCEQVYVEPCPLHLQTMPDTTAPPYAVASLPEKLYLIRAEENAVFAKETIPSLTVFGPLVGSISETRPDEFDFVCRNVQDKGLRYFQLDSDETANWMKFVRFADSPAEQNVAVYEVEETDESTACRLLETRVMFVTTEDISADEELKLGYSSNYADMIRNASWKCRAHLENATLVSDTGRPYRKCRETGVIRLSAMPEVATMLAEASSSLPCSDGDAERPADVVFVENVAVDNSPLNDDPSSSDDSAMDTDNDSGPSVQEETPVPTTGPNKLEDAMEHIKQTGTFSCYCRRCYRHFPTTVLFHLHSFQHQSITNPDGYLERDCPACEFHAANFAELVAHVWVHSSSGKECRPCVICGLHSPRLKDHMRLEHPQEMKQLGKHSDFLCAECGYTFKLKANYTTHMKKVHPQFQCWYCARILYSTEEFNAHTAEHAVDGVYPCSSCTATFPTYDASSEHFHECHDVANMKVCEVCLVVCGGQQKLAEHMQREHGQGSGRKRKRVRKSAPKSGGENGSMPV